VRLTGNVIFITGSRDWSRITQQFPAEAAMPLDQFIAETMSVLATDAEEILVEGAKAFRANVGPNEHAHSSTASINR
jgi:hypothetical protein